MVTKALTRDASEFDYDVCLSFAGEDRPYVSQAADVLRSRGVRVFYDEYEQLDLWGKDLYVHLDDVYRNSARYCVLFASEHYASKLWTNHERHSAQARAFQENAEYILPARFDDTAIPGLRPTVGYIDLQKKGPQELAELIIKKIGAPVRKNYFPPVPDKLFSRVGAGSDKTQDFVIDDAWAFMRALKRMSADERKVIFEFFLHGCQTELPDDVHISIDLLRRETGFATNRLKRLLGGLQSLGFYTSMREDDGTHGVLGRYDMLVLEWHNMGADEDHENGGNATEVACEMVNGLTEDHCLECLKVAWANLDFSALSTVTAEREVHAAPPTQEGA